MTHNRKSVLLCILDGWGHRVETDNNAIAQAKTPAYDRLFSRWPHSFLKSSAAAVGLPAGQMGNSEVGHVTIGAGRTVAQDLVRIDDAIASGSLLQNKSLQKYIEELKANRGTCHLIGLISPGGVHSHQKHIAALANIFEKYEIQTEIHAILDGRDTAPTSALRHLQEFSDTIPKTSRIATISGRYYAMDRDNRWDRTALYYEALSDAQGEDATTALTAIEKAYAINVSDEFITPTVIRGYEGMRDGDGLIMGNFRMDRVQQILRSLVDPEFDMFKRKRAINFTSKAGMVSFSQSLDKHMHTLFPPEALKNTLGEVVANAGYKQLRVAETEKYAHVTFFFNGGNERVFDGEERVLLPSPKIATYDVQPEMSADKITNTLVDAIQQNKFDLIVANYANADMVGHTGNLAAAIRAVETIDACIGRLERAISASGSILLITADHGNVECMQDSESNQPHTAHTTEDVPLIVANSESLTGLTDGSLSDVAPTVLTLLGVAIPEDMTGRCLAEFS